ncbi:hypothetical protein COCSUDRAFT_39523 [Coccomyxa subellipsoidea C-169]|uniref:RING-type domain-containing protein n=1 Tax=Coccomyxa subellipsoidea (strain C-169) TaxID=574566 RepID=I0Z701_COCSC|nr:hypothetical protein COCSUDRAFT_39523 [Coccomyxa subellipsoidea C-169]EIE26420.1 hypothetical protein COCSUDRAFT_39523 [Coccomyxa subellipsoidea C-169]|eukprot:XP_005650964.1 hypothetical protein COCSUDRAFT_39523 [Coccomyxa subellipsoidea C-169]
MLWRRLFLARWGPIGDELDNAKEWERPPTWRERYMERDALELQEVCGSVSELMRPFYAQMTAAKRSLSLGLQHPEDLPLVSAQYTGQVVAWRRARGLPATAPAHHTCQGRCSYSKLGNNVFVCEQCGWAHLCGDACTERFMDLSSELPVCPISGRCFTRMMTWAEEAREMDVRDTKGEESSTDHFEDFSTAGRLARAYVDGYNCTNEEELRRLCGVALVRLEQQTQEGAAKALAALRYEEQCEVQQLSEPASALSFLAHGTTDGVPLPDPGVALLVVRSSCPSNTSLSVQVLNRRAMQRTRDRRLLQAPALAPAPANASGVTLAPGYFFPVAEVLPAPGMAMPPGAGSPGKAPSAFPGLLVLGNKSIAGNSSSGPLLLSSDLPDAPIPPFIVPPPTATVQCCCYNATYTPFTTPAGTNTGCCCGAQSDCCPSTGLAICKGKGNYCFIIVTVSSVVIAFVFCLGFAFFYAASCSSLPHAAIEMVPKKTVEQSVDMEGQSRECPVCWDKVTRNAQWRLFSCRHGTCEQCYKRIVVLPGSAASCPLCRMPLVEPRPRALPVSAAG